MKCLKRPWLPMCAVILWMSSLNAAEPQAVMPEKFIDVIETYCLDCHDEAEAKGEVNLEALSFTISKDIHTAERWQEILDAVNAGDMPPRKKKQIAPDEKAAFLEALSVQMVVARDVLSDNGGRITLRRLNRREYAHTIESLIGIKPDVSNLPDDLASTDFDTGGASLFLSSDQIEQYINTARGTLKTAVNVNKPGRLKKHRIEAESVVTKFYREWSLEKLDTKRRAEAYLADKNRKERGFGFVDRGQARKQLRGFGKTYPQIAYYLGLPEAKTGGTLMSRNKGHDFLAFKAGSPGTYRIRVRTAAYKDVSDRYQYLEFSRYYGKQSRKLGWRKVVGTIAQPQIIEFTFKHDAHEKGSYRIHQRLHGGGDKRLWSHHQAQNGIGTMPGFWIDWAEIEGPLERTSTVPKLDEIFFEKPSEMKESDYAAEVITSFAAEAFRIKTPEPAYVNKLVTHFSNQRQKGMGLIPSLIESLSIVLASPSFLYMVEETSDPTQKQLSDMELAVRLSYFLWSEGPDRRLLSLARSGTLRAAGTLRQETDRMLRDPRADRFIKSFLYQWLHMDRLGMFKFDAIQFPEFDAAVMESARQEIYESFKLTLEEDLPIKTLLKADFVVVNDILANYYRIPGVQGHQFRKVKVPAGNPRGGWLASAAVLAMGSDGIKSSPVERGAWVLRHLLNDPPPPAPANVPQLDRLAGKMVSNREIQILHQQDPQCAQCHEKIDPIGYGMEHFNAAGAWRELEQMRHIKTRKVIKTFEIHPQGQLPSGESFEDFLELRDAIEGRHVHFTRGLAQKLITYGLGRPYGFTDQDLVDSMLENSRTTGGHTIRSLIHALIQSDKFQSR